jgi:hypothetical protein
MQDDPDTPDPGIAHALEAWAPLAPPADFADRVLAARTAAPQRPAPRRRARRIGGLVLAGSAAA